MLFRSFALYKKKVDDPSKYGVVVMDGEGKVERFVEVRPSFLP